MKRDNCINFFFIDRGISLRKRTQLKKFIKYIFHKEGFKIKAINYIFCSDKQLLDLNIQFLNHIYYTDILTFDLSRPNEDKSADIYISIDRVKDNAKIMQTTFKHEIHRVIFHGALHLSGYKDKSKSEEMLMRRMEDKYLNIYF